MKTLFFPLNRYILVYFVAVTAFIVAIGVSAAMALKPGEVSLVAELQAGLRAVGAMDPDEKVRNPDYLAEKFLPSNFWFFGPLVKDYQKSRAFIKVYRVNRYYTANALTRHIDGILQAIAEDELRQVVIIGAGFDSRAYRFGKQMPEIRFFEVEQPATLNRKKEMVVAVFGALPENVTYIPIDCRSRTVFDALKDSGYRDGEKTLFIWEYGASFTDRAVVGQTLKSIGKNAAAGSEVVLGYVFDEVVRGDYSKHRGAFFTATRLSLNGEPWKFGIAEGRTDAYITQYGLEVLSDMGSAELARTYLVRSNGKVDGSPTPYSRVIHAKVGR